VIHGKHGSLSLVSHEGAYMGFRSELLRFPEQRLSVAVLCNLSTMSAHNLARQVASLCLAAGGHAWKSPVRARRAVRPATQIIEAYVGDFAREPAMDFVVSVQLRNGNLVAVGEDGVEHLLMAHSETEFFSRTMGAHLTFHREPDGSVKRITLHRNGEHDLHRADLHFRPAADFSEYAGGYFCSELELTLQVEVAGENLTIRHADHWLKTFSPKRPDGFATGQECILFRRDHRGRISSFAYSAERALNLVFVRQTDNDLMQSAASSPTYGSG
jgi:hypothetical protein